MIVYLVGKGEWVNVPDSLYNSAPSVLYYDNVRFIPVKPQYGLAHLFKHGEIS